MTVDLSDHIERKRLVLQMQADVDVFCKTEFEEGPRTHLGASIIGDDCLAKAWLTFRWAKFEDFNGRMLRLFNRGHSEEPRFVRWLVGIGFQVRELDPETKKQYRIVGSNGHFGGSLDAMAKAPDRYGLGDEILLVEFKTHNDKSFAKLKAKGVCLSKPMHYRQMCSYGRAYGYKYALYCAVNKNDDELHFEIVELDYNLADDLFRKADRVISSQTMPPKIAQTANYSDCSYCHYAGICHRGEVPTKNCRSCKYAVPVENAEWRCQHPNNNAIIPADFIIKGCESYARIV